MKNQEKIIEEQIKIAEKYEGQRRIMDKQKRTERR